MTVNYTGGSRQAHRRVARKSQIDATGAPSYRVAAPSRSAAIHLASLRNTFKQPTGVGKRSTSSAAAASVMPRFNFSFAQQEEVGQQHKRKENASSEEMMRILYTDDTYDPNNPLARAAPPPPMTSFATFSDQRRRVLATGDWAGLGSSSSNWKPARPAAGLALSRMTKRPRTRTPSPEYTPLTPPPRGGFLRGSSVDLATDDDDDDHGLKAGEEDGKTTFESVGDYSSEIEDAVILLPERGHPGATEVHRSEGNPGSVDPLASFADQGKGSLAPTEAREITSIAVQGAHFQWSARQRLAATTTKTSRRDHEHPLPCLRPPRPQEPPASLAKVQETEEEEEQDLLKYLSGVQGLSREDQPYEPAKASPPTPEQPQPHDSLELCDCSPDQSTADEDLGGARLQKNEEQAVEPPIEKLAARAVDSQEPQEKPQKGTKTVVVAASPAAQPAVEPRPFASAFPALHEYVAPFPPPQDDIPAPSPATTAAARAAEWDLDAMWRDMQGFLPAPPDLAPIRHLAHLRDEAFALHEPDELATRTGTIPTFAALDGEVLLVSEQMGLGCEALTAEQADAIVKREMAMRALGVMPIEWYSNEEEEEPSDTEKRPRSQQLGRNGAGGQGEDESHDDEDEEGWDPDAEDVDQRGTALPGRRILIPGLLFASDDDTGILEP